jgi:hypothetical protein
MILQGHTDTVIIHTSLSACFEMDAHNSPVMINIIELIGIDNNYDKKIKMRITEIIKSCRKKGKIIGKIRIK